MIFLNCYLWHAPWLFCHICTRFLYLLDFIQNQWGLIWINQKTGTNDRVWKGFFCWKGQVEWRHRAAAGTECQWQSQGFWNHNRFCSEFYFSKLCSGSGLTLLTNCLNQLAKAVLISTVVSNVFCHFVHVDFTQQGKCLWTFREEKGEKEQSNRKGQSLVNAESVRG